MVVDAFWETTVLVDMMRSYPPAATWLKSQTGVVFGITLFTWMEIVLGSRDKPAQQKALQFLEQFEMVFPAQSNIEWAMQQLATFRLRHNLSVLDCLIAAVPHRLKSAGRAGTNALLNPDVYPRARK